MRIAIASGIFHPDSGGPATYLYRLIPELLQRGHEVRVLSYGDAPVADYPYPVRRIPFSALPVRLARYGYHYWRDAQWSDLVYVNTLGLPRIGAGNRPKVMKIVGDYAWERCVNWGLISPHEDIDHFQGATYAPRVEFFKRARAAEAQRADHVIVPSEYLRQMVIGWGADPAKVQVIYNALESTAYGQAMTKSEARAQVGWTPNGKYLLTVARLTAWKGVDLAIDALADFPDLTLVVAGDGPTKAGLMAQAAKRRANVIFLGKVPHEQVARYMRAADYMLLYSGYEGLSHVVLEALYAGTPVIASARGGNPETITDGVNGLLVKHPDVEALKAAFARAFVNDLPATLAAGTAHGLDKFAWPALVEQTIATLTQFGEPKAP